MSITVFVVIQYREAVVACRFRLPGLTLLVLLVADAFHHFLARGLGRSGHHFAARRLASTAPDGLTTHGNGFGLFTGFGHELGEDLYRNLLFGELLDRHHEAFFVQAHQAHGFAFSARATGAPDAVHVVFADIGDLVVHHVRQIVDVDATGGDVGGHQRADGAGLETFERLGASGLALVAMQRHRRHAVFVQVIGHVVGAELGAGEHQHLAPVVLLDDVNQQRFLLATAHRVDGLPDALHRGVGRRDLDVLRVAEEAVGQFLDLVTEGGREQQALFGGRQQPEHLLHVVNEAHVQHAVGFIEHQDLHLAQIEVALIGQVEQAARGSHQHIHSLAEFLDLRIHAHTTKDHGGFELQMLAVGFDRFFHLGSQLAGGGEHQGPHRAGLTALGSFPAVLQAVQHGQRESGGLASARLSARQQIAAGQHGWNGLGLNGSGGVVALLAYGVKNGRGQFQFFECHVMVWRPSWAQGVSAASRALWAGQSGGLMGRKKGLVKIGLYRQTKPQLVAGVALTEGAHKTHCRIKG